jgi:hypothetical protein
MKMNLIDLQPQRMYPIWERTFSNGSQLSIGSLLASQEATLFTNDINHANQRVQDVED